METIAIFNVHIGQDSPVLKIDAANFSLGEDSGVWFEADDIEIAEITPDGYEEPYEVRGETWGGHRFTDEEALASVLTAYVNHDAGYDFLEVCGELADFRDSVHGSADDEVAVGGLLIPKARYDFLRGNIYDLLLVTNYSYYYGNDWSEDTFMFATSDGRLVSDNYFAYDGLISSFEDVLSGEEQMLYANDYMQDAMREYEKQGF